MGERATIGPQYHCREKSQWYRQFGGKKIGPKGIWGEISIQINQNYVTQKLNMFYVKLNSSSAHWFFSLSLDFSFSFSLALSFLSHFPILSTSLVCWLAVVAQCSSFALLHRIFLPPEFRCVDCSALHHWQIYHFNIFLCICVCVCAS